MVRTVLQWGIGVCGLFLLIYAFDKISWTQPLISDYVIPVLEAHSVLQGNIGLHGWTLPTDTFYTTDLPFYVVGVSLFHVSVGVAHHIPALLYALLVGIAAWTVTQDGRTQGKWVAGLTALLLSGVGAWNAQFLLLGPIHVGTLLYVVAAFGLLARGYYARRQFFGVLGIGCIMLAFVGDPMTLWIGALPIIFASAKQYYKDSKRSPIWWWTIGGAVVALLAGAVGRHFISEVGGFHYAPFPVTFASWSAFVNNLGLFVQGILLLFGANFFGHVLNLSLIGVLIRGLVVIALGFTLWRWRRDSDTTWLDDVLASGIVIDCAAYLFSSLPVNIETTRYLTPVWVFGLMLVSRYFLRKATIKIYLKGAIGGGMLIVGLAFGSLWPFRPPVSAYQVLASWLMAHHLTRGYGGYWDASIITVATHNRVRIAPVIATSSGVLEPFQWNSSKTWYRDSLRTPASFLVYDVSHWGSVDRQSAIHTWGMPANRTRVGAYTVLVYRRPLIVP